MPRHLQPIPDTVGTVFSTQRALAAGVTPGRLRGTDLDAPHRGVRVRRPRDAEAPPARDHAPLALDRARRGALIARVEAYEIVRPSHAFYAGRTAIALYDRLFDDDPCEARLDVAVLAPARAPRMKGVRGIQLAPHLVTVRIVDGRPVASPASVWAQLAGELDVVGLVRLGDALVRVPRGDRGVPQPAKQLATNAVQWERDIEKHAAYAQLVYALVRVTQRQIDDGRAAARVLEALRHRGWMG